MFGMTISRRPKRRASSENAPGPSSAIAAASMISPARDPAGKGTVESAKMIAPPPMMTATRGVRNPISKQPPTTNASAAINQLKSPEFRYARPWTTSVRATNPRSRRRPRPGAPLGNAEKNFCRLVLLSREFSDLGQRITGLDARRILR